MNELSDGFVALCVRDSRERERECAFRSRRSAVHRVLLLHMHYRKYTPMLSFSSDDTSIEK
jgi:hypothetical protein